MARFRLKDKHYLAVPGTEWEHQETNQQTQKRARKVFPVPLYLDPEQPADHNYPGEIIVTTKADPRFPKDILFEGKPTPDMEPLDEESERLHAEYMKRFGGRHPIESLEATGMNFSDKMLEEFQKQIADLQSRVNADDAMALKRQNPNQVDRVSALERQLAEVNRKLAEVTAGARRS